MIAARTLAEWLAWMESNHPRQIELGLDRVGAVAARLGLPVGGTPVITVAGTNGKGSCVAFIESMVRAAGRRVGCYTSPHLLRYNERVRIDGETASDDALCMAFAAIDAVRGELSLTYFEFGTLAALWLFAREPLDLVVLEVGLGGRLDAVNLVNADVAVVTSIDIDHEAWLGNDRESIGREKAGVFRAGRPAICADPQPPRSLGETAAAVAARWLPLGEAFLVEQGEGTWHWSAPGIDGSSFRNLPLPQLPLPSAAAALAALRALAFPLDQTAARRGLSEARLQGRFQQLSWRDVEIVLDVAHNPHAARYLAQRLAGLPPRPTWALCAMMADKALDGIVGPLSDDIEGWFAGDLPGNQRALPAAALAQALTERGCTVRGLADVPGALSMALAQLPAGSRLLVFGSFFTVAAALQWLQDDAMRRKTDVC